MLDLRLYLVTDDSITDDAKLLGIVESALKGGVTLVQYRDKKTSAAKMYQRAKLLKSLTGHYNVPLLINDRLDIALAVNAEGLHIGQSDLPYSVARKILGPKSIIGLSVENLEQAKIAEGLDVDYIGVSPIYKTPTKTDTENPFGLDGLKAVHQISRHPLVAIGGIKLNNATDVIKAGATGLAIVSGLSTSPNPKKTAEQFLKQIALAK